MSRTDDLSSELSQLLRHVALLGSCSNVLGWDEQTYMPKGGALFRSDQLGLLAGLTHEAATSPRLGELLGELESDPSLGAPDSDRVVNVREARRSFDRSTKLPRRLVEELSRTTTLAQQAWVQARDDSDFASFLPWLDKLVRLKREEAQAIGYGDGVPYDALLDEFEPGATTAEIRQVFAPLREELVKLVTAIGHSPRRPKTEILTRHYPKTSQIILAEAASRCLGFDFERGRIDASAHPFCSGFGPGDCRLTTRYHDHHFPSAFFGVLHESGHGIYEQGLNSAEFGTGLGQAASLGIHESQSRLWENLVGRSRAFWDYMYPTAQQAFPVALGHVGIEDFCFAINDVRASLIRVESDEVTYNLHIMLRFEIEQLLISGDLNPVDVPGVWNEKFLQDFGVMVPNDSQGCLQDIHWSAGLFGYFPTYALGNMYAAQFFSAARRDLGNIEEQFAEGHFKPLRNWLNEKIHTQGKRYPARRLVEVVTGQTLSHQPLMDHLNHRFGELYGLS